MRRRNPNSAGKWSPNNTGSAAERGPPATGTPTATFGRVQTSRTRPGRRLVTPA